MSSSLILEYGKLMRGTIMQLIAETYKLSKMICKGDTIDSNHLVHSK